MVLGFDSGYWGMQAGHTMNAVASGIPTEVLAALANDEEELLAADYTERVAFIRAVRDGGMTDELWAAAVRRMGSVRAAMEFAFCICYQFTHHRMMWAMGCPAMLAEDWWELLEGIENGSVDPVRGTYYSIQEPLGDSAE
jgi:hypothetical protein